ncbi:TPA: efflux transporter outer membrane subunit [Stenotrophomonas maltophilia]|uniref:efflux transporter outer membrane subunit n=1 Tax=Stenotrophomonas maltophilia TaxID=40324 RepID=UPI00131105A1|nr:MULTISPECIES: efflux transporter outer membrane subunit [Stenotrophomonas]
MQSLKPLRNLIAATCIACLSGCASMAPQLNLPTEAVPARLVVEPQSSRPAVPLRLPQWRQLIADPRLLDVVALALSNNRDLRAALLNVQSARANLDIQAASALPSVNGSAGVSRQRTGDSASSIDGGVEQSATAQVQVSAWELDLFGRIRSLKDQTLQSWLSTTMAAESARMVLVASTADAWISTAAAHTALALSLRNEAAHAETVSLTRMLKQRGAASLVDVAAAEAAQASAREAVGAARTQLDRATSSLELLVGQPVPEALLPLDGLNDEAVLLADLPDAIDSRVLLQRPDVALAEHDLRAANANIGAARAAFFPTISLTASTGHSSGQLDSLFTGGASRTWSFLPTVTIPLFNAGKLRAELDVAELTRDIRVAQYEKSIQLAFSEVAAQLADRRFLNARLIAQGDAVAAARTAVTLAKSRRRLGLGSSLHLLVAQRDLVLAEEKLLTLRQLDASNRIMLYKVLGVDASADLNHA